MLLQVVRVHSLLLLQNVSFICVRVRVRVCVCVCHIFFIHSPLGGHVGGFHSLAILRNAAKNIYFFKFVFSFSPKLLVKCKFGEPEHKLLVIGFWGLF